MYTLRQSAALFWGKIRRSFLVNFRKKRVEEKLARRRGACTRCGACCKLLFNCPAYDDSDGNPKCLIYNDRPGVCGLFPLDEKDLRERDFVMPGRKCGFTFADTPNDNGNGNGNGHGEGPLRMAMPLRWGPPKKGTNEDLGAGDGKPKWLKGVSAIVWAYFHRPRGNGKGNGHSNGNGNGRH